MVLRILHAVAVGLTFRYAQRQCLENPTASHPGVRHVVSHNGTQHLTAFISRVWVIVVVRLLVTPDSIPEIAALPIDAEVINLVVFPGRVLNSKIFVLATDDRRHRVMDDVPLRYLLPINSRRGQRRCRAFVGKFDTHPFTTG